MKYVILIWNQKKSDWARYKKITDNWHYWLIKHSRDLKNPEFFGGSMLKGIVNARWFVLQYFETEKPIDKKELKRLFKSQYKLFSGPTVSFAEIQQLYKNSDETYPYW